MTYADPQGKRAKKIGKVDDRLAQELGFIEEMCPICYGNDADVPCAYTTERKAGCLRVKRLGLEPKS
jgi:hypothetical protein